LIGLVNVLKAKSKIVRNDICKSELRIRSTWNHASAEEKKPVEKIHSVPGGKNFGISESGSLRFGILTRDISS
jgi:hypothetical protein